jgi:nicotinamide-nucleotide amidase
MKEILAEIITIGDEILYGQILDTNTQWLSAELDKIGIKTIRKTTIGDVESEILSALAEAEERADLILITGGLGPTNDDITKPSLARYFDSKISIHPKALAEITAMFEKLGKELSELNKQQAALPEKCKMISNSLGTAPGMWFEKKDKIFISMPGVPHEMKAMMSDTIIPKLITNFSPPVIYHKIIKTAGVAEAWLAEKIQPWERNLPSHIKLAYLPSLGRVRLRLTAIGSNLKQLKEEVNRETKKLLILIDKYVYGFDDEKLEEVIGRILSEKNKTMAIAESCTGGHIAHMITSIPGSSDYFKGGLIPYHNDIKINVLGVKKFTIERYGAVSEETVKEMANNIRTLFHTDIGVASSGIAGPGGGTPDKPVGTVWIAYADGKQTITKKLMLAKDRLLNIQYTTVAVLELIRQSLNKKN